MPAVSLLASPIDLNRPGGYVHWSVLTMSIANLSLIIVMVVIFGLALLLPFPHGRAGADLAGGTGEAADRNGTTAPPTTEEAPADPSMWTARARGWATRTLPPGKLLPDRQPAYVSSWIYIFGVGALAALAMCIVSGFAIAIGGTDWWHTTGVGHFFNSLHLWSVELFMALMVVHLWGKFWMAAWRGRRKATWVTGVVAFLASVVECFTGYLSQTNFDSQWISTNGKDATNAAGVGAFFNLMNVGQMLLWHVVLIPIVLIALVGGHVLLVRARGVVHPLPQQPVRGRSAHRRARQEDAADWTGPTRRYDILKEGAAAVTVVVVLVVVLAGVLSSPDRPSLTVATWSRLAPADFVATAASELAGTSETANYGPPYNSGTNNVQRLLFSPQTLAGVRQPIDPARSFVISPLTAVAPTNPTLQVALAAWSSAGPAQQDKWNTALAKNIDKLAVNGDRLVLPAGDYGPLPVMLTSELVLARSGSIDADLLAQKPFYNTNFTKPLLFIEDGNYYSQLATGEHLTGSQWGVMNETGSYPGQPWLWLYTLWYQVRPFKNSANVDLMAVYLTGAASIILLALPWIPGLRAVPERVPLYRLVWKNWYRGPGSGSGGDTPPEDVEEGFRKRGPGPASRPATPASASDRSGSGS